MILRRREPFIVFGILFVVLVGVSGCSEQTPAAGSPEKTTPSADLPVVISEFLDQRVENDQFSGVVLLAHRDETIFAKAFGFAEASTGRTATLDTPFNIGSMNKMFTGLAIAQLEARGLLEYNDLVGKYLSDYPNEQIRTEATIHHLLTHTSGIPSYWNQAYAAGKREIESLQDFARTFQREPLDFAPGTDWRYSNGGPVVLGLILEHITGMTYYDYVRQYIYEPAGMSNTDHYRITDEQVGFATGYLSLEDGVPQEPNSETMGLIGSSAGGGYSTVNDLRRFTIALAGEKLLSQNNIERLWSPPKTGPEKAGYGYLWGTSGQGKNRWVGHNGGAPGVSADFRYFPESGQVLAVLSNVSRGAMPVSEWLANLIEAQDR